MSSSYLDGDAKIICDNPIRSPLDKRSYVLEKLSNGLRVQWIHSPDAEESMVVIAVASGSLNNEGKKGWIAHATEHFLCMGSKKYPRRDEVDERVTKHGGYANATTWLTSTEFHACINTKAADKDAGANMEEAFAPFLQQFIEPAFDRNAIDREVDVIENEFKEGKRNDWKRLGTLDNLLSNPEHPLSWAFTCGNRKSLGDPAELRPEVTKHYEDNYCAGLMQCVAISPLPIQEVQDRLRPTLAAIPNRGLSRKVWGTIPRFLEKDLATVTYVEAVTDVSMLFISFYFPGQEDNGYSASGQPVLDLLIQKAEGGLYDVLQKRGLAREIQGRVSYEFTGYRELSIFVSLTQAGVKHYQDVVHEVWHMIARMKAEGPQEKLVEESARLEHIMFCTKQIDDTNLARTVAGRMLFPYLKPENLVYGSNEILIGSTFNDEHIVRILEYLQPENMRLTLLSKEVKDLAFKEEQWYGTKWATQKILPDEMARYTAAAALSLDQLPSEPKLPPQNPFITQRDFESEILGSHRRRQSQALETADEEGNRLPVPMALHTGPNEIWVAPGKKPWDEPRIKINICIRRSNVFTDAESGEKTNIFMNSIRRAKTTLFNSFDQAALSYHHDYTDDTLGFFITGYKEGIRNMLESLLPAIRNHQPEEADFKVIKEDYLQRYQSWRYKNTLKHSAYHLAHLTCEHGFTVEQDEAALKATEFEDMRGWGEKIFNTAKFQFLISGDVTEAEAAELWPLCQKMLALNWQHGMEAPRTRARLPLAGRISLFKRVMVDPENENSSVDANIFLAPSRQAKYIAAPDLLIQILEAKVFDTLRTEHNLGYDVGVVSNFGPQQCAIRFYVQGSEYSCVDAAQIMLRFIKEAPDIVEKLSPEEFEQYRKACMESNDKKPQTLTEYQDEAWSEIFCQTYDFYESEHINEELRRVTQEQLVDLAKQLDVSSPKGTQLWLFMEAKGRETPKENPDYIALFPKDREVGFVNSKSDFPDLTAPEEAVQDPEDFLVKPENCSD